MVIILLIILAILYGTFNPYDNIFFPKCPFKELTSLKCPGCGSQRAIHNLLNFQIYDAINENVVLVLSIPYILIGFVFDSFKKPHKNILKWRKKLYGQKAIIIILIIIMLFWIIRNIKYMYNLI